LSEEVVIGKKYIVELTKVECKTLWELISSGKAVARGSAMSFIVV
jgi:hypothetical protein